MRENSNHLHKTLRNRFVYAISAVLILCFLLTGCSEWKYKRDFSEVFDFNFHMTKDDVIRYEAEKYNNTVYEFTPNVNDKEDRLWFEPSHFQGETAWKHLYFFDKETGLLDRVTLMHADFLNYSKRIECKHIDQYVAKILSIIGKWDKVEYSNVHTAYGTIAGTKCTITFEDSDYLYVLHIRPKDIKSK